MGNSGSHTPGSGSTAKFAVMSVVGVFLFMVPIPDGQGAFNIPLGFAINWLGGLINSVVVNGFGLLFLLTAIVITVSFLGSLLAYTLKPAFIMGNEKLKTLFLCNIVYFVSKAIGAVLAWLVFFSAGPDWLIGWDGARLMMDLIASGSGLMAIFIIIGIAIPLLTDFGLMEFLGILIKKVIRFLFTLPGRSSIDLLGSWFSSSAASVIITRDQHEKGYYTGREAAAICVNFTLVSLPFTFVVASTIGLTPYFPLFYLIICVTAIILAMIMPRIWPLNRIKDEYLPEVGKQIDEEVPANISLFKQAITLASRRASKTGPGDVLQSGVSNWLNIFMDLIPVILAWGTVALIINAVTPIFQWLSWPFGQFLQLLQVPGAMEYAHTTIVGFIDMYLPAIMLGTTAPIETRFILGALSIVQIIYMAETGILILKSKIPLNIGHLAIIFVMRTIFALPVLVLLTRLLFHP
ncbi:MAG: hypothetical protein LBG93_01540 [Treponema sp.]|jgi:nucleoside recognition membrane protein YjiH|nr:hypothetical protein [Treponema sp.]